MGRRVKHRKAPLRSVNSTACCKPGKERVASSHCDVSHAAQSPREQEKASGPRKDHQGLHPTQTARPTKQETQPAARSTGIHREGPGVTGDARQSAPALPRARTPERHGGTGECPRKLPSTKSAAKGRCARDPGKERPQTRRETTGSQAQVCGRLRSVAAPTKPPAAAGYSESGTGLGPHYTSHCTRPRRMHALARQPTAPKYPARQSPNTPAKRASTGTHLRLDADDGRGAEAGEHAQCGVDRAWPASMRSVGRAGLASMRSMGQGGAGKQARLERARRRALLRQRRAGGRGVARGNRGRHPWVPVFPAESRHGEALGRGRKEGRPARGSVDSLWPPPSRAGDGRSCEARSGPVAARNVLGGLGVLVGFHSSS